MELRDAIYGRRAIRDYQDAPLSREVLTEVITDAVQAPNSVNRQAWSFFVVQGRLALATYSRQAKVCALEAFGDQAAPPLRAMMENPDFNIFYNAPALVVICATLPEPMVRGDCWLAAQTLMLAAHGRGLGACPIGFADPWLQTPEARAELSIPQAYQPVTAIIVGVPKTTPPSPGRKPPEIAWLGEPAVTRVPATS